MEASLDLNKVETLFLQELCSKLGISPINIKSVNLENWDEDTQIVQVISVELTGNNHFKSEDVAKIEGLTIITPNRLQIKAGEINL